MIYGGPSATNLTAARLAIASFLVVRGPYAYMNADKATIEGRDLSNPHCEPQHDVSWTVGCIVPKVPAMSCWADAMFQLETGRPTGGCNEESPGVFSRRWTKGSAKVDCGAGTGMLNFKPLAR